ncbi:hypothetical protein DFH28DRAFT_932645 [Melampsora americana]|nr:hypothetical protein DFH28DRAFT_932645 [Melampsora americana]
MSMLSTTYANVMLATLPLGVVYSLLLPMWHLISHWLGQVLSDSVCKGLHIHTGYGPQGYIIVRQPLSIGLGLPSQHLGGLQLSSFPQYTSADKSKTPSLLSWIGQCTVCQSGQLVEQKVIYFNNENGIEGLSMDIDQEGSVISVKDAVMGY